MTAPLRRVLVVAPRAQEAERWREAGWKAAPDPGRLAAEHEAFRARLEEAGADVVVAETSPVSGLDAATQGPNVLALAPRVALALDGNPETRRRMERAGVDVRVYGGEELSYKGEGGPTCLTRPILRG